MMPPTSGLSPAILELVLRWYGPLPPTATEALLREVDRYCRQLKLLDDPSDMTSKVAMAFLNCNATKLRELRVANEILGVKTGSTVQSARLWSPYSLFAYKLRCLFGPGQKAAAE
jgi:hypothetical protein